MDRRERYADLDVAFLAAFQGMQSDMWTALPAVVTTAMDPAKRTVTVQPTLRAKAQNKDGTFDWVQLPVLPDVPVFFPSGGGATLTFPVTVGDECLVVFASRCIDSWWQSSGIQNQADMRMHDLSDAIAFVGISSVPKVISAISTSKVQLRSNDGAAFVEIDPTSHAVQVKTSGNITLDSGATLTIKAATQVNIQAPIIALQGNLQATGAGGGAGSGAFSNMALTLTGGSLTMNGKNISDTHTHPTGGPNTGPVN